MAVKARPIDRRELMKLLVTDADAFTAFRYLRHRENIPNLLDLEARGQNSFPGTEGVLADLYHSLWTPEPGLKEEVEVSPDRRYWRTLLGETVSSSAYAELHSSTQLSELKSVLGTVAMGESIIATVPKEDQKKLQELAEAQGEADQMRNLAQEAEAEANAARELAEAAQAGLQKKQTVDPTASHQTSNGEMTFEQAQALADQLATQAEKAKADAKAANEFVDEAARKAEKLAEELMGNPGSKEAGQKLRELTRIGLQAVQNAHAKVKEVSETIEAWGLEEAELSKSEIPEALALLERMKRNEALKKFAGLLGSMKKIAARKAKSKIQGEGARIVIQETGRDIKRAHRSELTALVHPALRAKAFQRWARGELRLFGQKTRQKLGRGPVVVCEDASGSMDGVKQQWAKAVVLALAHYAKLQKRSFGWIMFDAGVRKWRVYPEGRISAEQMLELVESHAGGGTDFESPLRKAVEMIQTQGLKKADICFITDGECAISQKFVKEFAATKRTHEINVFSVLCDVGRTSDATLRQFSDRVEKVSTFTLEDAEKKVFGNL